MTASRGRDAGAIERDGLLEGAADALHDVPLDLASQAVGIHDDRNRVRQGARHARRARIDVDVDVDDRGVGLRAPYRTNAMPRPWTGPPRLR